MWNLWIPTVHQCTVTSSASSCWCQRSKVSCCIRLEANIFRKRQKKKVYLLNCFLFLMILFKIKIVISISWWFAIWTQHSFLSFGRSFFLPANSFCPSSSSSPPSSSSSHLHVRKEGRVFLLGQVWFQARCSTWGSASDLTGNAFFYIHMLMPLALTDSETSQLPQMHHREQKSAARAAFVLHQDFIFFLTTF